MQRYSQLKKLSAETYLIGVTGHIGISDHNKLKIQIRKILNGLKEKNHPKLCILCPGAEGGDQLVAEVAMETGINIRVIALRLVDYTWHPDLAKEFAENQKWLENNDGKVTNLFIDDLRYKNELEALNEIANDHNRKYALKKITNEMLCKLSSVIAGESDYIIALWDGVDNGKVGGTSETVHMALHGKDFNGRPICFAPAKENILNLNVTCELRKRYKNPKGYLFQVVTPRSFNPFPIGRFPAKLIDNIPNAGKFETGLTVFPTIPFEGSKWRNFRKYQKQSLFRDNYLLSYWLPAVLALTTVLVGGFGFKEKAVQKLCETRSWIPSGNDFFSAINLITFDASKDLPDNPHFWALEIARLTGLALILNAFFIAVFVAIGKNNKIIGKVKIWRLFGIHYQVIVGLNDKSYHLMADLLKNGKRLIIITGDADEVKIAEAEKQGANVFVGNPYSLLSLHKIRAQYASKVYFLHDDDTLNIRSLNELDQLSSSAKTDKKLKSPEKQNRYIHIGDFRYKDFIFISHPESDRSRTQAFNLYENTARRLMRKYPIYRFNLNKPDQIAAVFVFGFGEMAEEIVLNALRLGFYNQGRKLKITVFTNNHIEKRDLFYKKYPVLWRDAEQNPTYEKPYTSRIREEVFPKDTLTFKELPMSDGAYFSDDSLDQAIRSDSVVTLYFCTPLSVQSAAYLQAILPKIAQLQRSPDSQEIVTDIQCFCHYNLFDQDEVAYAEHVVNARIPNSAVIFFGSFVHECTERCFDFLTEDRLPKLINLWYNLDESKNENGRRKSSAELLNERMEFWEIREKHDKYRSPDLMDEAREMWKLLSPMVKESNLHAAEHIWTKLYLMGTSFFELNAILEDKSKSLSQVAKQYAYTNENPAMELILEMAKVEHRRWCAERLLEGFLSFHDFYPDLITAQKFPETISKWNNSKDFKDYYQLQKQHLDLIPFDQLFIGKFGKSYDEKVKDISLIEAIPYLMQQGFK